jgi:hypothetical protein
MGYITFIHLLQLPVIDIARHNLPLQRGFVTLQIVSS